ncbi:hypothetical protein ACRRTK_001558 [Alexandromys fortis]
MQQGSHSLTLQEECTDSLLRVTPAPHTDCTLKTLLVKCDFKTGLHNRNKMQHRTTASTKCVTPVDSLSWHLLPL